MRKSLAYVGAAMMVAAITIYATRGYVLGGRKEPFAADDIVGMEIDRNTDPVLVAAMQKMMDSAQWLSCVPLIQLEKMARTQSSTGAKTLKATDVTAVIDARKTAAMANIKRLPYSPEFKAGLNKYVDYSMTSMSDILKQFSNADNFVDLDAVAKALSETRAGFCKLGTNFGTGNSFLNGTA